MLQVGATGIDRHIFYRYISGSITWFLMMTDQHIGELPPNKNTEGSHNQYTEQNQKEVRATHITKITRGNNNKGKKTALQ
jgi:hypothetical protein